MRAHKFNEKPMSKKGALLKFKAEADIIGRLLVCYTDLELALALCVAVVGSNTFDEVIKAMYGMRGEKARIDEAEKRGGPHYQINNLGNEFSDAISAIRNCRTIRNQYAHAIWWDDWTDVFGFANLEEVATINSQLNDFKGLTRNRIDVLTLEQQENYFQYTDILMLWLNHEAQVARGRTVPNTHSKPAPMAPPPLCKP